MLAGVGCRKIAAQCLILSLTWTVEGTSTFDPKADIEIIGAGLEFECLQIFRLS
jgi:hypothetical protein